MEHLRYVVKVEGLRERDSITAANAVLGMFPTAEVSITSLDGEVALKPQVIDMEHFGG